MQQLFQSGFLLGLGKAITFSIWQMGLLFLAYQLIIFILSIKQARVKNFISSTFSLIGFVWFVITLFYFWNKTATSTLVVESGLNTTDLFKPFTNTNSLQLLLSWAEFKLNYILPYLSIAYLFVLVWFCTKLIYQLKATNYLRVKGVLPVAEELQSYFSLLTHSLGITKKAELFFTNRIDIPATLGFLKPIVLLPAVAVTHLTPAQLEAVLLHELAHIKRNDYFWNLLLSVSETILFFNPFTQLLIGIARREREISCDDVVMSYQQNAAVYAEALLNVELARQQTPQLAMALGDNKHHLKLRVKRILNLPAEKNKISTRLLALLFFTFVFAFMGWGLQQKKTTTVPDTKTKPLAFKNKDVFFIKPDAILTKDRKAIGLGDEKHKVKLQLTEELVHDKYIIWNEAGESASFGKIIISDFPEEWVHEFIQPEKLRTPSLPLIKEQDFNLQFHTDSVVQHHQLQKMKEVALRQLYITQLNRYKKNINTYKNREVIWPNTSYYDSLFTKKNGFQNFEMYTWHEQAPFGKISEGMNIDKMKQLKNKLESSTRLLELRKPKHWPNRIVNDSVKKQLQNEPIENVRWAFTFAQPVMEELIDRHENLIIKIENNQVQINGVSINRFVDSTSGSHTQQHIQKRIRVLEVIKL